MAVLSRYDMKCISKDCDICCYECEDLSMCAKPYKEDRLEHYDLESGNHKCRMRKNREWCSAAFKAFLEISVFVFR